MSHIVAKELVANYRQMIVGALAHLPHEVLDTMKKNAEIAMDQGMPGSTSKERDEIFRTLELVERAIWAKEYADRNLKLDFSKSNTVRLGPVE